MENKKNTIGLLGFIFSIISIVTLGLTSIVGLILSIFGLSESKKCNKDKEGLSVAGIVISSIMLFILIVSSLASLRVDTNNQQNNVIPNQNEEVKQQEKEETKIDVIDMSNLSKEEIQTWCTNNKIICKFEEEYSDTIENGKYIKQSIQIGSKINEYETIIVTFSKGQQISLSKQNALGKAKSYLRYMAFSYSGLIKQLEYEKYPHDDAVWAVDNCGADWYEQAVKKAQSYLKYMNFSHDGLVSQLEYEGFTYDQAEYGVSQNGL